MASDPLLPVLEALLRLQNVNAAELEGILRQLPANSAVPEQPPAPEPIPSESAVSTESNPEPQTLTPEPAASTVLNPNPPEEHAPARETILVGFSDDDAPFDPEATGADEWSLPTDEEPAVPPQPQAEADPSTVVDVPSTIPESPTWEQPESADDTGSKFGWDGLETVPAESKPAPREDETDRRLRQIMAWSSRGLLVWGLFVVSFFVGVWFLRSAPPTQLASKTASAADKSRDKAAQRREAKSFNSETMLAKEELIAAEDAQVAMVTTERPVAVRQPGDPDIRMDRNDLPKPDDGIVIFPAQQDFPAQPNQPVDDRPGPSTAPPPPDPSSPFTPLPFSPPVVFMPVGGGGFGPFPFQGNKNPGGQGGKNTAKQSSNAQAAPASNSNQRNTSSAPSNQRNIFSPSSGVSSSANQGPPSRTPTTPGHSHTSSTGHGRSH